MNVGGFSEYSNKTSDTDTNKGFFFTARVSLVNGNTMKRIFEQLSQLLYAKCLIVHVMSSNYNVSSLELRIKRIATHQWNLHVPNDIVINRVRV